MVKDDEFRVDWPLVGRQVLHESGVPDSKGIDSDAPNRHKHGLDRVLTS